jgi:hypothetical protein
MEIMMLRAVEDRNKMRLVITPIIHHRRKSKAERNSLRTSVQIVGINQMI